jgi:hypothetical protein
MTSASIVDSLDPVTDGDFGCGLGRPQVSVVELDFQCGPKRFLLRVVPRCQVRSIPLVISELSR